MKKYLIKLQDTKTQQIYIYEIEMHFNGTLPHSRFFNEFDKEFQFALDNFADYKIFMHESVLKDYDTEFVKDFENNWNTFSEKWTSPRGVEPIYKCIKFEEVQA